MRCAVSCCGNLWRHRNLKNSGISYHRFPRDPYLRQKWIEACGITDFEVTENDTKKAVCSIHFHKLDFRQFYVNRKLIPGTVPTLNLYHERRKRKCEYDDDDVESYEYKKVPSKRARNQDTEYQTETEKIRSNNCLKKYNRERVFKVKEDVENVLNALKYKFNMKAEDLVLLKNAIEKANQSSDHIKRTVQYESFPLNLRSFAFTLNFYSPKAYFYVRKNFPYLVPRPRRLKKLYYSYKGEPGFAKEAFRELGYKADTTAFPIIATLVIGEMSLRRCIEIYKNKTEGYIDIGTDLEGDYLPEAKQVLVFLVTAINSNFKIPVGYFFVNRIVASQRANLVRQCLSKVQMRRIKIVALSFKGSTTDMAMAENLGCDLKARIVKFEHPAINSPVVVLWDLYHMLKLLLNTFKLYRTFLDKDGNKIEWRYVEELDKISKENYIKYDLGDSLGHIKYFKIERIKANLSIHPFTSAVIDAIQHHRKDLKVETFKGSKPTQHFLTVINNIVDVFTVKCLNNRGLRHAINEKCIHQFVDNTANYIANLKTENGQLLTRSTHKFGFLGTLGCLDALKHLITRLNPANVNIVYLPIYKLGQKQLELFLYNIKMDCKSDHPTARQFKYAYKNILFKVLEENGLGNGLILQDVTLLNNTSAVVRINKTTIYGDHNNVDGLENETINIETMMLCINDISEYNGEVFTYIVTYVVRHLIRHILCNECVNALVAKFNNIVYPSRDVVKICKITKLALKTCQGQNKEVIIAHIMRQLIGAKIFDSINYHQLGVHPTSNHVVDLMKAVVEQYINIFLRM